MFANSAENLTKKPTVGKVSGLKAVAQSKALKLTWKKSSSISGYEIQYSISKNFTSVKTVKVSKSKTGYTIKKLKGSKNTMSEFVRTRTTRTNWDRRLRQKANGVRL